MSKFNCDLCSACCRSIGKLVVGAITALDEADKTGEPVHPILEELAGFPYDIDESGACSQLDKDGGICKVYDKRPLVCNVQSMYDKHWSAVMSEHDWLTHSKVSCLKLQQRRANGQHK